MHKQKQKNIKKQRKEKNMSNQNLEYKNIIFHEKKRHLKKCQIFMEKMVKLSKWDVELV